MPHRFPVQRAAAKPPFESLRGQRGIGLLSVMLGMVVAGLLATGIIQGKITDGQVAIGRQQGGLMSTYGAAVNRYIQENYAALQAGTNITRNGATLAGGSAVGQTLSPRLEDLVALGYLPIGLVNQAVLTTGGTYQIRLQNLPVGCVGSACNVSGRIYLDAPVVRQGTNEMNGVIVGSLMTTIGSDVVISLNSNPTVLSALDGVTYPNPVGGNPPGVIGMRLGFGSSSFGSYVTLGDSRDPNFTGNLTVAGNIASRGGSVSAGRNPADTCSMGEIMNSGSIISRMSTCVTGAFMDGVNGIMGVNDAAGINRAVLTNADGGRVQINDGTGSVKAFLGYIAGGGSETYAYADNLVNSTWTFGVNKTGALWADSGAFATDVNANRNVNVGQNVNASGSVNVLRDVNVNKDLHVVGDASINGTAYINTLSNNTANINNATVGSLNLLAYGTEGAACSTEGTMAWSIYAGAWRTVRCSGGTWASLNNSKSGTPGDFCGNNGELSTAPTGEALLCQGNSWVYLSDRIGRTVLYGSYLVADGGLIPKPACAPSAISSQVYLFSKDEYQNIQYVNRYADDVGTSWVARIRDGMGSPVGGSALAQTYCLY